LIEIQSLKAAEIGLLLESTNENVVGHPDRLVFVISSWVFEFDNNVNTPYLIGSNAHGFSAKTVQSAQSTLLVLHQI